MIRYVCRFGVAAADCAGIIGAICSRPRPDVYGASARWNVRGDFRRNFGLPMRWAVRADRPLAGATIDPGFAAIVVG